MNDITELGRRITAAFDTIERELADLPPPEAVAELEQLRAALETERAQRIELETALAAARETLAAQDAEASGAAVELDQMREALAAQATVTQQLTRSHGDLRASVRGLREAQAKGVTEPELINKTMAAELDALYAARDSDRAEMDELLAAMQPFLEETQDA